MCCVCDPPLENPGYRPAPPLSLLHAGGGVSMVSITISGFVDVSFSTTAMDYSPVPFHPFSLRSFTNPLPRPPSPPLPCSICLLHYIEGGLGMRLSCTNGHIYHALHISHSFFSNPNHFLVSNTLIVGHRGWHLCIIPWTPHVTCISMYMYMCMCMCMCTHIHTLHIKVMLDRNLSQGWS